MPYLLHIETATGICSVAISKNHQLLALKEAADGFSHASKITILIQEALQEANIKITQVDAVAVSSGPGSYTSLRIGTATAKGICYALQIPLIVVDTLQALALASYQKIKKEDALYFPMIDARRMEVYTAAYDQKGIIQEALEAKIITSDSFQELLEQGKSLVLSGNGAAKCQTVLSHDKLFYLDLVCSAQYLIPIAYQFYQEAKFADIAYYSPTYFKAPNITKAKKVL